MEEGAGKKIVIISDDFEMRTLLEGTFLDDGYQVECADDGVSGVQLVKKNRPDVLLLDLPLPDMVGEDLAQALKAEPEYRELKVIAIKYDVAKKATTEKPVARCDEYLSKPINLEVLRLRVMEALREKKAA